MKTLSPSSIMLLNPSYFRPKRVKLAFEEKKKKKRKSFEKKKIEKKKKRNIQLYDL